MDPQLVFVTAVVGIAVVVAWLWWKLVRLIVSWCRGETPPVEPESAEGR